MLDITRAWVPFACHAFEEYRMHGKSFSRSGIVALKRMLANENVTEENCGMTKREWKEFTELLGR